MRMIPFVNLSQQYLTIKKEVDHSISRVLNRGWFILGEELSSFEEDFSDYCHTTYAVGVNSGTEALHLSLLACGVNPGDEVITVPNTAVPTVSAISSANAKPAFVDIDPETYTMDPNKLEEYLRKKFKNSETRINKKPKAVIPVHLYGNPADMDPILEIAREYELEVIEDACQAHGAEYKSKMAGSLGDAGCFSFYPTKNLGAYGDSGMVITNDSDIAEKLRKLRNYGEEKKYRAVIKGFNSRLDEIQAAVLKVKLTHLNRWNEIRQNYAGLYNSLLKDSLVTIPIEKKYAKHVYHLYVIRTQKRNKLQEWLKEKGIATITHYPEPIHLQQAYRDLGYENGDFPITEKFAEEILSLPMYPELTEEQIEYICQAVSDFQL